MQYKTLQQSLHISTMHHYTLQYHNNAHCMNKRINIATIQYHMHASIHSLVIPDLFCNVATIHIAISNFDNAISQLYKWRNISHQNNAISQKCQECNIWHCKWPNMAILDIPTMQYTTMWINALLQYWIVAMFIVYYCNDCNVTSVI